MASVTLPTRKATQSVVSYHRIPRSGHRKESQQPALYAFVRLSSYFHEADISAQRDRISETGEIEVVDSEVRKGACDDLGSNRSPENGVRNSTLELGKNMLTTNKRFDNSAICRSYCMGIVSIRKDVRFLFLQIDV